MLPLTLRSEEPTVDANESNVSLFSLQAIESQRDKLSQWIYDTSNTMDIYFSGSRIEATDTKSTYIDTSVGIETETYQPTRFRYNIKAYVNLPRTFDKLRLVVEDYRTDDSIDGGAQGNLRDAVDENQYTIGLQYLGYTSEYANVNFTGGLRFSKYRPDPFLSMRMRRSIYLPAQWELWLYNDLRYFVYRKLDNRSELRLGRVVNEVIRFEWFNSYRYQQTSHQSELISGLTLTQLRPRKMGYRYSASIYCADNDTQNFRLEYYNLSIFFRHMVYKNWIYYEVGPSLLWRYQNNFKPSTRLAFNFGIIFGDYRRYNDRRFKCEE